MLLFLIMNLFVRPSFSENQLENEDLYNSNESFIEEYVYAYNTSEDYIDAILEFIYPTPWVWTFIVLNIVVFVVGLFGNLLVCAAVYRNHSMRTVTNYFIVNLAIADFLVIVFCLIPTLLWDVTSSWLLGNTLCKVVLYLQTVSVTVSVLTLTFISVDRWYAICHPLKFKSNTRRTKTFILVIWIVAFILDIPEIIVTEAIPHRRGNFDVGRLLTRCDPKWSPETETKWQLAKMVVLYVIPLSFMSVTYAQIIKVLWHSESACYRFETVGGQRYLNFAMESNESTRAQLRSRKKAAKMLVAVVGMFAFCFFPVHLLTVLRTVTYMKNGDMERVGAFIFHLLLYINSAVNPLIYNFMNSKFRKEFHNFFRCCYSGRTRTIFKMSYSGRTRTIFKMNSIFKSRRKTSSLTGDSTKSDNTKSNESNNTHLRSGRTSVNL